MHHDEDHGARDADEQNYGVGAKCRHIAHGAFEPSGPDRVIGIVDIVQHRKHVMIDCRQSAGGQQADDDEDLVEALEQLKAKEIDLVLMDIHMPNMDGLEATRKIREIEAGAEERRAYASLCDEGKRIPIVGLTASARKEDEEKCYEAGMDDFLTKPINKDKFAATLNSYRERSL